MLQNDELMVYLLLKISYPLILSTLYSLRIAGADKTWIRLCKHVHVNNIVIMFSQSDGHGPMRFLSVMESLRLKRKFNAFQMNKHCFVLLHICFGELLIKICMKTEELTRSHIPTTTLNQSKIIAIARVGIYWVAEDWNRRPQLSLSRNLTIIQTNAALFLWPGKKIKIHLKLE